MELMVQTVRMAQLVLPVLKVPLEQMVLMELTAQLVLKVILVRVGL
jgi:hypothetical protein